MGTFSGTEKSGSEEKRDCNLESGHVLKRHNYEFIWKSGQC